MPRSFAAAGLVVLGVWITLRAAHRAAYSWLQ